MDANSISSKDTSDQCSFRGKWLYSHSFIIYEAWSTGPTNTSFFECLIKCPGLVLLSHSSEVSRTFSWLEVITNFVCTSFLKVQGHFETSFLLFTLPWSRYALMLEFTSSPARQTSVCSWCRCEVDIGPIDVIKVSSKKLAFRYQVQEWSRGWDTTDETSNRRQDPVPKSSPSPFLNPPPPLPSSLPRARGTAHQHRNGRAASGSSCAKYY